MPSEEDIADTVAAFASAAADAKRLGFDTVELHEARGYLIDWFFWSGINACTDAFGGASIRERTRFAAEAVRAGRVAVGPDFPLILRISQWKQQDFKARLAASPEEMSDWLAPRSRRERTFSTAPNAASGNPNSLRSTEQMD